MLIRYAGDTSFNMKLFHSEEYIRTYQYISQFPEGLNSSKLSFQYDPQLIGKPLDALSVIIRYGYLPFSVALYEWFSSNIKLDGCCISFLEISSESLWKFFSNCVWRTSRFLAHTHVQEYSCSYVYIYLCVFPCGQTVSLPANWTRIVCAIS